MGCGSSSQGSTESREETQPKEQPQEVKKKEQPKPTSGGDSGGSSGNAFIDQGVSKHNELRKRHGVPPLTHAQDLTAYSQDWVNKIAERDTMEHSKCTLPSGGRVGENIYCFWSSGESEPNANDAVQAWYDEIKDYNFSNQGFSMGTGHFTQVVWKGTQEVGIAHARAKSGTIYIVANYRPAGNMMGDFENNVLPPL